MTASISTGKMKEKDQIPTRVLNSGSFQNVLTESLISCSHRVTVAKKLKAKLDTGVFKIITIEFKRPSVTVKDEKLQQ